MTSLSTNGVHMAISLNPPKQLVALVNIEESANEVLTGNPESSRSVGAKVVQTEVRKRVGVGARLKNLWRPVPSKLDDPWRAVFEQLVRGAVAEGSSPPGPAPAPKSQAT